MSLLPGATKDTVADFRGARPLLDPMSMEAEDAVLAMNCKFDIQRRVQPREGFGAAWSPNKSIASMKYWAQGQSGSQTQYLTYLDTGNSKITIRNLATGVETDLLTGLSDFSIGVFAPSGQRLCAAILSAAGGGSHPGYIWDGNLAHTMDQTFQRPMLTTEVTVSLTSSGAGVCTAGTHYVGVLFQTRTGYWTRPGPANTSLTLQPVSISSSGSGNVQVTVTPATTWPSWIQAVQVIYTSAANSFQYYLVPGTITSVTAGGAAAAVITVNIADLQLRSIGSQGAGTLADDYFDLLSMDSSNTAPFNVKFVIPWGDRMVWFGNYGGIDSFFPSDKLNHQWIQADQHIRQLPGGIPISTAFVLRGVLYVCSPAGGIYGFVDNGGRPVTWSSPVEVDASIAVLAPLGVTVDSSGNGYALIGAQQGLYVFPGLNLPELPGSYYAGPDWDLIDWTQFTSFVVKDFPQQRLFLARATLTNGSVYIFAFNNLQGKTPDKLRYSAWTIGGAYPVGPIEIVQNTTAKVFELWIAPSTAGAGNPVLRQMSLRAGDALATLYADNTSTGIDWRYNMAPLPPDSMEMLNNIAVRVRAKSLQVAGANLYVTVASIDGGLTLTPNGSPFALAQAEDQAVLIQYDFTSENALYRFSNNSIANNAPVISLVEHFHNLLAAQR